MSYFYAAFLMFFFQFAISDDAFDLSFPILLKEGIGTNNTFDHFVKFDLGPTKDPASAIASFCNDHNIQANSCTDLDRAVRTKYFRIGETFGDWNDGFSYVFITAFYDIGREQWTNFQRRNNDYFEYFNNLLRVNIPLIVFIDEKYYEIVCEAALKIRAHNHLFTVVIKINEDFLTRNILSWSYIGVEEDIISSLDYQEVILVRPEQNTPETMYPQYNCINHAKIDFIKYVIDHEYSILPVHINYMGWVDFGYVTIDSHVNSFELNSELLFSDHVNVLNTVAIDLEVDSNPLTVLSLSLAKIHGAFWFGSISALQRYHSAYHHSLQGMHAAGIADDDQAVMLQVLFNEPNLLKLWRNAPLWGMPNWGWYVGFVLFNRLLWDSLPLVSAVALANQRLHLLDQQNEYPINIVLVKEV